ncbi:hypothetical protein [Massilia sp. TSP1-1-2]|uniref:hypothetical protein n=1 Tax=unclassified Massilia TaxID=2609279 RepID=UPI003CF5B38B
MRNPMHTEPTLTANQFPPADALAMSALQSTREAIARWSGKVPPAAAALPRDTSRVSPQARWVAETQRGLAAFFEHGGFSQFEGPGEPRPVALRPTMHTCTHEVHCGNDRVDA